MRYLEHNKLLIAALAGMLVATAAMAQYAIPASVIGGGGSNMSGTSYAIVGTIGQPFIGVANNASYADSNGFWYASSRATLAVTNVPGSLIPKTFSLEQNYPNPFNPTTEIRFAVPNTARVTIKVFNIDGQLVETLADQEFNAGDHSISWSADRYASGLYLIRMSAPNFSEIRRAVLLK